MLADLTNKISSKQVLASADSSRWLFLGNPALVIFWDIDGTLVSFNPNQKDKHFAAVQSVVGEIGGAIPSESGMTDRQIIQRYLEVNGIPATDSLLVSILEKLDEITEIELRISPVMPLPGSLNALREMRRRGWSNAVLTGNTPKRAALKLDSAGLGNEFFGAPGFFGAIHSSRESVVEEAMNIVSSFSSVRIAVVGDTPRDVDAARSAGLPVAGVATGKCAFEELELSKADLVIPNLDSGLRKLIEWLRGLIQNN